MQALEHELPLDAKHVLSSEQLAVLDEVVGDAPENRLRPLLTQLPDDMGRGHAQFYQRVRRG